MNKVRWGIVGCGDVVRKRVARAIIDDPNSELVAACRRDQEQLREFSEQFAVPRSYATCDELLADAEVDAVYIATPVNQHRPQTVAAAKAGKHVLIEKPMALTADECREMIAVCKTQGVKLGTAYYRRFYPVVQRMKELMDSGEIGKPISVTAITAIPFAMQPGDEGYWRVVPEQGGGGALMDVGSHRLNLFLHLLGDVEDVQGFCDVMNGPWESEDCATLAMRFRSGAHGLLHCVFGSATDPDEFSVLGTKGRLFSSPLNGGDLRIEVGLKRRMESLPPANNFNAPLIADFVAAVLEDKSPEVTGEEGCNTNLVMERAYQSARPRFSS
ncbi:MAG: Gfo/Idh/MocA family oxidoreductase [Planctomycetales bacterium]